MSLRTLQKYPVFTSLSIGRAYLSEYFTTAELFNLTANTLLSHSMEIQLPNLAIADKFLDERFAEEESAAFDLDQPAGDFKP